MTDSSKTTIDDARFAELALAAGLVSEADLEAGREEQRRLAGRGQMLGIAQVLLKQRKITSDDFLEIRRRLEKGSETKPEKRSGRLRIPRAGLPDVSTGREVEWGEYAILGEIARGGMGIVYRARQKSLGRIVALKILREGTTAGPDQVARFEREAALVSRLRHPGIVSVHDAGVHEGLHFFSMDFVEGRPLDQRMAEGPLEIREGVRIVAAVARAIDHAHEQGVIHRDLKPANVLLDPEGRALVTDFGLAKLVSSEEGERPATLTQSGAAMGTPYYMSPEQARGEARRVDRTSDVFSLGVILYEILAGRLPFQAQTRMDLYRIIQEEEPTPLRRLRREIPRDLETICLRALEKHPARRYPTSGELADDLERVLAGEPILARPVPLAVRLFRSVRRRPLLVRGVALALVAATSAGVVLALRPAGGASFPTDPGGDPGTQAARADEWKVVLDDGFDRDEIGTDWIPMTGDWTIRRGRLVGRGTGEVAIRLAQPITGDVRLEYRAKMIPRPVVCDLSSFLFGKAGHPKPWLDGYFIGFGSYFNRRSYFRRSAECVWDSLTTRIRPGEWHEVRVERAGHRIRLEVDGRLELEYLDFFPIGGKDQEVLGLYTYDSEAEFDRVVVHRRRMAETAHPLEVADGLFRSERYGDALFRYEQFYQDNPDSAAADEARYKRALCIWKQDAPEKALDAFEAVIALSRSLELADRARLHRVQIRIQLGREAEALEAIREFLDEHPDRPGAVHFRQYLLQISLELFRGKNRPERALPFWREALVRFPDDAARRAWIARHVVWCLLDLERHDEVLETAPRVQAEHAGAPFEMAFVQLYVGLAHARSGRPAEAIAALQAVIDRYRSEALVPAVLAQLEIGEIRLAAGDEQAALEAYGRVTSDYQRVSEKESILALRRTAEILARRGEFEAALGACYEIGSRFAHDRLAAADARILQGDIQQAAGRPSEARSTWTAVLAEFPDLPEACAAAGERLRKLE